MDTINIKNGNKNDIPELERIIRLRPIIGGMSLSEDQIQWYINWMRQYFNDNDNYRSFISYSSEGIKSWILVYFWKTLPFYTILGERTNPETTPIYFDYKANGIGLCFDHTTLIAEQQQYYRCYIMASAKQYKGKLLVKRQDYKPIIFDSNRYIEIVEEVIPANQRSLFKTHDDIGFNISLPVTSIIRSYSLKNEYRIPYKDYIDEL